MITLKEIKQYQTQSFDPAFEALCQAGKLAWYPWVGKNYPSASNKILVILESHYIDKAKSNERQELAGLFGEMAFNQLHDAKLTPNQRSAWHALIGGIMGQLSNKDFLGGATAAGINEMLIKQIEKASHGDPALMRWMSAAVGGITGELVSKSTTG